MHTKITNTRLYDKALISFGFAFLLLFVLSTKASAATGCTLAFSMNPNASSVVSAGTVTRTLTVKNTGTTKCQNISYSLFYSPNEIFVSGTPAPRASNYYWYVGTLNRGKEVTTSLVTRHNSALPGTEIVTEGCAAATGMNDVCVASRVALTNGTIAPIVIVDPAPFATTTPIVATTTPIATTPISLPVTNTKEQGIWIWNFPSQMLSVTADLQLKQLKDNGFNAVYITIDDYIDIASMPAGTAKEAAKKTYFDNLAKFVLKANNLGMAVDAEGGWRDWAQTANRWKGFALIDAAKEYNALHPEAKLRGLQYDVEPYILPEYETNKAVVLTDFVAFIDQSAQRLVGTNIKFSLAIPHFYDDAQAWTPSFAYDGKTTWTFNHLLNILEKIPGSTILLMSYRDTFEGSNGTRQISETEIKQASVGYSTNIIVSQETGNVDPDFVTYYGGTKVEVMSAVSEIKSAFNSYSRFGGIAIHYMDSFLEMN